MFVRKVCAAYDHHKHNNTTNNKNNNNNNNNNNHSRNWVLRVLGYSDWKEGVIAQHIMKKVHDSLASLYLNSSIVCFLFLSGITTARRYYKDMSPLSAGDDNRYI